MAFGAGMGPLDFHDESHRAVVRKIMPAAMGYVSF